MFRNFVKFLVILSLGSLSAQTFVKVESRNNFSGEKFTKDTLKIFAVMVDFQTDKNTTTAGTGKFGTIYSKDYGKNIIDPLPHDKQFFEKHLDFAVNYYRKVSDGKLNINYRVYPDVITVTKEMKDYSPPVQSTDYTNLAGFANEVWTYIKNNNVDLSGYDLFTIFHAGVGRDISVPGSIGNDKDLPSVYLSLKTLQKYLGTSFNGFPVKNNNVTNTMILPETSSREISGLTGTALLELSFNGLLVANIASHLGLPDLFNTSNGYSAIGRFGLMDGQAMFSYSGVFPPEPSAWEKIYLGWVNPIEINEAGKYPIYASRNMTKNDTTIIKIPINDKEYYLIENKHRDVNNDGISISYFADGKNQIQKFSKDTTGFRSYTVDSLKGVITDVDEFDWAAPGNGIAIWHIDERVIDEKINDNTINADKKNKGVDLEEADGVQDIGESFTTITGEKVIGEGYYEDLWFKDNKAKLYKNIFDESSFPDTYSNSKSKTHITINDFSAAGQKMTFNYSKGNSIVKPMVRIKLEEKNYNDFGGFSISGKEYYYVNSDDKLVIYKQDGTVFKTVPAFSDFKIALNYGIQKIHLFGVKGQFINRIEMDFTDFTVKNYPTGKILKSPAVIFNEMLFVGCEKGEYLVYNYSTANLIDLSDKLTIKTPSDSDIISFILDPGVTKNTLDQNVFPVTIYQIIKGSKIKDFDSHIKKMFFTYSGNARTIYVLNENGKVSFINPESFDIIRDIYNYELSDIYPAFGFENNIGVNSSDLLAFNASGYLNDNFPVQLKNQITDLMLYKNTNEKIIAFTKNGDVYNIDINTGEINSAFPISIGDELKLAPVMFNNESTKLGLLTKQNNLHIWQVETSPSDIFWSGKSGNISNNNIFIQKAVAASTDFFPENKAYNWPNPVYGEETNIRFLVNEQSNIQIRIFDLSGNLVKTMQTVAQANIETEIKWNVKDIASGVYMASLEAKSLTGKNGNKIIKILVIK